jgi:hypothetical protein
VSGGRPAWTSRALSASARWFDAAPPPLQTRLASVRARVASAQGQSSVDGALTAPGATPFLALTEAFRSDLQLPEDGAVDAVGAGSLALYFYLRIQDDVVDEPALFDRAHAYAAEIFAGLSAEAYARAVGASPAFWGFRRAILTELASVSAWELDTYRALDLATAAALAEEHSAMLGSKLVPMAIPLAALAAVADRQESFSWLGLYARALGRALQIANDLLNARDDHVAGRLTPTLAALYAGGRVKRGDEAFRVWPLLAGDAALERMLGLARLHAGAAINVAAEAGALALAAATRQSATILDEIPVRLLRLAMGVVP